MPRLCFKRHGHGLYPADDTTAEWLNEVQPDVDVVGDLRVPRNARNHKHMFAILREAAHNIDGFADEEALLEYLKLEAGMYKVRSVGTKRHPDGTTTRVEAITYESLKFESMDEVRFKRVKERFLYILYDKFGFEPSELEARAVSQIAAYGVSARPERGRK